MWWCSKQEQAQMVAVVSGVCIKPSLGVITQSLPPTCSSPSFHLNWPSSCCWGWWRWWLWCFSWQGSCLRQGHFETYSTMSLFSWCRWWVYWGWGGQRGGTLGVIEIYILGLSSIFTTRWLCQAVHMTWKSLSLNYKGRVRKKEYCFITNYFLGHFRSVGIIELCKQNVW